MVLLLSKFGIWIATTTSNTYQLLFTLVRLQFVTLECLINYAAFGLIPVVRLIKIWDRIGHATFLYINFYALKKQRNKG